jgi:hypothetical protein
VHGALICLLLVGLGIVFIAEYESRETVSTAENRRLAAWPQLTRVYNFSASFLTTTGTWTTSANTITYDKVAEARISYGGRGQIMDLQQPRYGQQVLDTVLPF